MTASVARGYMFSFRMATETDGLARWDASTTKVPRFMEPISRDRVFESQKEKTMSLVSQLLVAAVPSGFGDAMKARAVDGRPCVTKQFTVHPIGWVRKMEARTTIVVDKKYQPALLGLDDHERV